MAFADDALFSRSKEDAHAVHPSTCLLYTSRIIIVGFLDDVEFTFPKPVPECERKTLADILEVDVDKKYYVRDAIRPVSYTHLDVYKRQAPLKPITKR